MKSLLFLLCVILSVNLQASEQMSRQAVKVVVYDSSRPVNIKIDNDKQAIAISKIISLKKLQKICLQDNHPVNNGHIELYNEMEINSSSKKKCYFYHRKLKLQNDKNSFNLSFAFDMFFSSPNEERKVSGTRGTYDLYLSGCEKTRFNLAFQESVPYMEKIKLYIYRNGRQVQEVVPNPGSETMQISFTIANKTIRQQDVYEVRNTQSDDLLSTGFLYFRDGKSCI